TPTTGASGDLRRRDDRDPILFVGGAEDFGRPHRSLCLVDDIDNTHRRTLLALAFHAERDRRSRSAYRLPLSAIGYSEKPRLDADGFEAEPTIVVLGPVFRVRHQEDEGISRRSMQRGANHRPREAALPEFRQRLHRLDLRRVTLASKLARRDDVALEQRRKVPGTSALGGQLVLGEQLLHDAWISSPRLAGDLALAGRAHQFPVDLLHGSRIDLVVRPPAVRHDHEAL